MNIFDDFLAKVAMLARTDGCQVESVMQVAFDAKARLDAEFGTGNRYSISLTRLMLRLNHSADRRERIDTTFRLTELLSAASEKVNRREGKLGRRHQAADFMDTDFGENPGL